MQVANTSNVKLMEFSKKIGPYEEEMVAIFNKERVTIEEVVEVIQTEMENENVIIVSKEQYKRVFL